MDVNGDFLNRGQEEHFYCRFPRLHPGKSVGKQGNTGAGGTGNGRRHEVKYEGTLQLWVKKCSSRYYRLHIDPDGDSF